MNTPILWMKFPDEGLLSVAFGSEERARFERLFECAVPDSAWQSALIQLHFPTTRPTTQMIRWHQNCPYFNWTCMIETCAQGAATLKRQSDSRFLCQATPTLSGIWALIKAQWRISKFLQKSDQSADPIAQSLALGIALQFFVLQLGSAVPQMGAWLAGSLPVPQRYRRTIQTIQNLQLRRTSLSEAWHKILPASATPQDFSALPDFFWDDVPPAETSPAPVLSPPLSEQNGWKGLSVCAGAVTGLAVIATSARDIPKLEALKAATNAPLILVFRNARPETTEIFHLASAVLFAEGGILSHAATIAREMNLPAITGLGPAFFAIIKENDAALWLNVDATKASITIL